MTKYEITSEQHPDYPELRRIRALRNIPRFGVKAGDVGGWVESEANLSQDGDAWVSDNAWVSDDARVRGNALVRGNARVFGNARLSDNAWVSGEHE